VKLEAERIEFAMRMSDWIVEDRPVIYFDETTFNPDMHQKKAWYYRGSRFAMPLRKQSMKKGEKCGFSVYGAVSTCIKNGGYFELHSSSNKNDFCAFMERLEKKIIKVSSGLKPVCILDNLSAHKGPDRRAIMNKFCKPEFIPTYSCELNGPIETLWAVLKRRVLPRWTKLIVNGTATKNKLKALVKDELHNKIEQQIYKNILRAHYPYLQELLSKAGKEYNFGSGRDWDKNEDA
jgi:transposase